MATCGSHVGNREFQPLGTGSSLPWTKRKHSGTGPLSKTKRSVTGLVNKTQQQHEELWVLTFANQQVLPLVAYAFSSFEPSNLWEPMVTFGSQVDITELLFEQVFKSPYPSRV